MGSVSKFGFLEGMSCYPAAFEVKLGKGRREVGDRICDSLE